MTTEEKAKAYDKTLERAKESMKDGTISQNTIDYLCNIFPELAESEDERIKREFCKDIWTFIPNEKAHKYIAWLEKQGSLKDIIDRYKDSWYNEGKIAGMAEGLTDDEKYQQGWHDALEKQGEQKAVISDDALKEGITHFGITQYQIDNWLKKYIDIDEFFNGN